MLGYFPYPYKDETLYSVVARYHFHIGNKSKAITMRDIFKRNGIVHPEYMNKVSVLVKEIAHFIPAISAEYLYKHHTTAPMYYPFMNANGQSYEEQMTKYFKVKNKGKFEIPPKNEFYFCKECLKEQFKQFGEGYWNRLHQIPGLLMCKDHELPLSIYQNFDYRFIQNSFILPNKNLLELPDIALSNAAFFKLLELSKDIHYFFDNVEDNPQNLDYFNKYKTLTEIHGIAYPMNRVKEKLAKLVSDYYGDEVLDLLHSNPKSFDWINFYFTKGRINKLHPVRHIILMRVLVGSAKNYFEKEFEYKPFGEGPWKCMNPLSPHYLEKVVKKINLSIHQGKRNIQGDFICECGFTYRLYKGESDPLKVNYFSNRVMEKGKVWEEKFYELVKKGLYQEELAQATKLSRPTIRKILREGPDPIQNGIKKKANKVISSREKKTKKYREIWIQFRENNPHFSRKQLASLSRSAYCWLHMYDQKWLYNNSPATKYAKERRKYIDYLSKDKVHLEMAKNVNENWSTYEKINGRLLRKTYYAFITKGRFRYDLTNNKEWYPQTVKYINSKTESFLEFQKRKIMYILEKNYKDKKIKKYSLIKEARLSKKMATELDQFFDEIILKHNQEIEDLRINY